MKKIVQLSCVLTFLAVILSFNTKNNDITINNAFAGWVCEVQEGSICNSHGVIAYNRYAKYYKDSHIETIN